MKRFAEGTQVSVDSSRAEISGILTKHGVVRQAWASEPDKDTLQFELEGHVYRFLIARPSITEVQRMYPNAYDYSAKLQGEWKRRWRANVLLLKAKLEFADGDASTVIRELMPYAVLSDGRTLEEAVTDEKNGMKLLAARS